MMWKMLIIILITVLNFLSAQNKPFDVKMRSGKIYYQRNLFKEAKGQFELAVLERPDHPEANFYLGLTIVQLGDYLGAAKYFLKMVEVDTNYLKRIVKDENYQITVWSSLAEYAQKLIIEEKLEEALPYARACLKVDKEKPLGYTILGHIYTNLNRSQELVNLAQELIEADSFAPEGYNLLGSYYFNKAHWDSAITAYKRAEANYRHRINKLEEKFATLIKKPLKETKEVIQVLSRYQAKKEVDNFKKYVSDTLKLAKVLDKIAQIIFELNNLNQERSSALLRVGLAAFQKGNDEKAETVKVHYFSIAEQTFSEIIQTDDENLDAFLYLGFTQYSLGKEKFAQAETTFKSLLKKSIIRIDELEDKDLKDALVALITDTALSYFEVPEEIFAKKPELRSFRYFVYRNAQNRYLSKLEPNRLENVYLILGACQVSLAKALNLTSKYDEAISSFSQILEINPKSIDAYQNLAIAYRDKGDKDSAYKMLKKKTAIEKEQKK